MAIRVKFVVDGLDEAQLNLFQQPHHAVCRMTTERKRHRHAKFYSARVVLRDAEKPSKSEVALRDTSVPSRHGLLILQSMAAHATKSLCALKALAAQRVSEFGMVDSSAGRSARC